MDLHIYILKPIALVSQKEPIIIICFFCLVMIVVNGSGRVSL